MQIGKKDIIIIKIPSFQGIKGDLTQEFFKWCIITPSDEMVVVLWVVPVAAFVVVIGDDNRLISTFATVAVVDFDILLILNFISSQQESNH